MDFIAKYGSSPVDRKNVPAIDANGNEAEVKLDSNETVAYIFKHMTEAQFGELSFFRVYSGTVTTGTDLFNSDRKITSASARFFCSTARRAKPSTRSARATSARS